MKISTQSLVAVTWVLIAIVLLPTSKAVVPPPDGGYPGGNTAEGQAALFNLTSGSFNTAVGYVSLRSNATGSFNTAVGAGTLLANTANENTATGAAALLSNTTGGFNTGAGAFALFSNTEGSDNTAIGEKALFSNTTGDHNTASGLQALLSNISGTNNTAIGVNALVSNTIGSHNDATGFGALQNNTTGVSNTAAGENALQSNSSGSFNTAIGLLAGASQTTGSSNVYIGAGTNGIAGESDACYIRSIFGQTSANGLPVLVNSSNKLGTTTSSRRFKQGIKPMDGDSEALFALKPVTFRYNNEIDPEGRSQFGLVAEDVESVSPDLIVRDKEGNPYSVRYDHMNAMLLNEFLKEHKRAQELQGRITKQEASIADQRKDFETAIAQQRQEIQTLTAQLKEQAAQIQKVSAQVEMSKPAARTVANK